MFYFESEDDRVMNSLNETNLEYIQIQGLFGQYDINLDFSKQVNIFIGENGLGKTTILNCIYYLLNNQFENLKKIDFSKISIKFKNEHITRTFSIADVIKYSERYMVRRSYYKDIYLNDHIMNDHIMNDRAVDNYIIDLLNSTKSDNSMTRKERVSSIVDELATKLGISTNTASQRIFDLLQDGELYGLNQVDDGNWKLVEKLSRAISENITQKIIYLPTYRRIENDFSKVLLKENKIESNLLIRFGMEDVRDSIDRLLTQIKNESIESFNKMTGVLLRQYSSREEIDNWRTAQYRQIEADTAQIVLDRLQDEIKPEDKATILNLLKNGEIYHPPYAHLLNLIRNLIDNYDAQRRYDDKIKRFAATCNKYLKGKKFYYNQSTLSLDVQILDEKDKPIGNLQLAQLSSGEKQIVSLFSKLYLDGDNDTIVIIDEPELSLSLNWQSMLLPDVIRSDSCKLLLTVTHSPFIFENEFDSDAKEMRACITPTRMKR